MNLENFVILESKKVLTKKDEDMMKNTGAQARPTAKAYIIENKRRMIMLEYKR